jgi:23S rRNA pseudouridine1911/1915/1917 synthase
LGPPFEAGLLHRLDTETSGILVAARTRGAFALLRDQWRWKRVEKVYLALVDGEARGSFTMLVPIGHHPKSRKRMVTGGGGRSAETRFRTLYATRRASLLVANLREGRRHQIRVHLAAAGHPIVGDRLYARGKKGSAPRLLLHAWRLRFPLRPGEAPIDVACPPPADFEDAVARMLGEGALRALRKTLRGPSRRRSE